MIINKRMVSGNVNWLRFLFPRYKYIEIYSNEDITKPIIYSGDISLVDNIVKKCQDKDLDYIVKVFYSDINFEDRRILANIVFEKWRNATVPKYLEEIIDDIPKQEFEEMIKIKWVSGKWNIKEISNENTFLSMIEELNKSKYEFIKSYFKCIESNKPYILEASFISFLQKAKNKNYSGNSFQYKKKLEMYKDKKLNNTLSAIDSALEYNIDNQELRLLNILMSIQDSSKKA